MTSANIGGGDVVADAKIIKEQQHRSDFVILLSSFFLPRYTRFDINLKSAFSTTFFNFRLINFFFVAPSVVLCLLSPHRVDGAAW